LKDDEITVSIPNNIKKERILNAIEYIDVHGVPERRLSKKYELLFNGTLYPPRYVIDLADIYEDGGELRDNNGEKVGMHSLLEGLGFKILYPNDEIDREQFNRPFASDKESHRIQENKRYLPDLEPSNRSREYNIYNNKVKDTIIYEYLFKSMSHRWLDENIIGIAPDKRTGHQSMNILHFIGLRDKHKGILKDLSLHEAVNLLEQQNSDFSLVIKSLKRLNNQLNDSQKFKDVITADIDSEQAEDDSYYQDGAVKKYYGKRYERNPENRKKAIEIHGLNCVACGFNFEDVYGERGKDFIEVHHVKPLSSIGEGVVIDPMEDLVPVCSNCHRMIHRRKDEVLTVDELTTILNREK
jgi:5-methylcytosine-specific restriction enzyme A